jgi:hypothetical protein
MGGINIVAMTMEQLELVKHILTPKKMRNTVGDFQ